MKIIVFLGAPGSGKGTQAKRLAQSSGYRHFSTGDMLRAAIQAGSEVGLRAKVFIDKGELVPDSVMIDLIESALSDAAGVSGAILDGFPRTVPQAEALDKNAKTRVHTAIHFTLPESLLINRLTGRRVCEKCGEPFHVLFIPPKKDGVCDKCGSKLIQRTDDSEGVVRRRLEIFAQQNGQLLSYYGKEKKLRELDADHPVDFLQSTLTQLLQ